MTAVVAAQRGQPRRSSGCRTGWQMMTMTAASTSGPTSSRAKNSPASAITAAASPRRTRRVGGQHRRGRRQRRRVRDVSCAHGYPAPEVRLGVRSRSRATSTLCGRYARSACCSASVRARMSARLAGTRVVVPARRALDDPRRDGGDDEADHDDAAGHQEHRRDAAGQGHGHVVPVTHCRHGAERPPDRCAEAS